MSSANIRGRSSLRVHALAAPELSSLPYVHRARGGASRPRAFLGLAPPAPDPAADPAKKPRPPLARLPPTAAVISAIALAFFVFGILVSRNISAIVVSPGTRDLPLAPHAARPDVPASLDVSFGNDDRDRAHAAPPPRDSPSKHDDHPAPSFPTVHDAVEDTSRQPPAVQPPPAQPVSEPESNPAAPPARDAATPQRQPAAQPKQHTDSALPQRAANDNRSWMPKEIKDGRVGWNRSWPISEQLDFTGLIPLASHLNFSNRTLLNYFHMHKTGGVTTKSELMGIFNRPENKRSMNKRGQKLSYIETCYEVVPKKGDKSTENMWRCDFGKVREMTPEELASVDLVMGHQYWNEGCDIFFSKTRDVRHFSLFRHPLPRKLSFFYHFFVRNLGRDEAKVGKDEVIKFLLAENLPEDPRSRDAGPNYYASRMMSDGMSGFINHQYLLNKRQQDEAIADVLDKLDNRFAMVGLQLQNAASQCMLEKVVQVFTHEHGIDEFTGTPKLSFTTAKLNQGEYPWTARKIWDVMTAEHKRRYREVEKVDLAIYDRVVRKFKEDVKIFSCEDKVDTDEYAEDVFE